MSANNDESRKMKQREKITKKEEKKPNSIETITLDILQSKKNKQKLWLNFQDIIDAFENKAFFIDYWTKSEEFKIDLQQALSSLETAGKIEKKAFEQESYFSSIS